MFLGKIQEINRAEAIGQARDIFISYFTELYKDIPPNVLGIENVPDYLQAVFTNTEIALKERVIRAFLAYSGNEPVGFSTCGLLEDPTMLLVRTMPVHLDCKNGEIEIRNAFLVHMRQQFPKVESVVMMVRKANVVHASLCLQTGFTKDAELFEKSDYLKTTYNPVWYEAYRSTKGRDKKGSMV